MELAVQVILASAFILVLLYITLRLLNHLIRGQMGRGQLEVIEAVAIGRKSQLVLVRAGEQCYLLGVSDHAVELIKEMPKSAISFETNRPTTEGRWGQIFANLAGSERATRR